MTTWITIPELAEHLRVSDTTIRRAMARRVDPLPHSRIGKQYRFSDADVAAIDAMFIVTALPVEDPNPWGLYRGGRAG